uniref:Cmp-n-acetylneuraminate-beta-galactosamide-alpha--sialyltransferase 1 n=1 Tax=Tetraselmis sp. GSL018 TaxID=582737 RepID=A0A061RJU4_9CHLO
MANNFHSLIASGRGPVTRCSNSRSEHRPSIETLPILLQRYVSPSDIFVHQGNYRRLLGRENFTELKCPHLLPRSAASISRRFGFRSCAIVGNSGALLYSKFGQAIDRHEVVFRLNQAPTKGYEAYVGRRASFRLLNSLWTHRYSTVRKRNDLAKLRDVVWGNSLSWSEGSDQTLDATELPLERGVALIVSRCSVQEYSKLLLFWAQRRPDVMVLMLNSRLVSIMRALLKLYRVRLCQEGWGPFEGGGDPSSGLVASYLAHQLCRRASVYGFGSERVTSSDVHTPYHYYKFYGARQFGNSKAHSFDTELNLMSQLYNASVPHPAPGHPMYGPDASAPGNVRMCRTERGYTANAHNTRCRAGLAEPRERMRREGPLSPQEVAAATQLHKEWNIPVPVFDPYDPGGLGGPSRARAWTGA